MRTYQSAGCGSALALLLGLCAHTSQAQSNENIELLTDCSAYFFMAANVKAMSEYDAYYTAGEYAYNQAVKSVGEEGALEKFNRASSEINRLIERNWLAFDKADARYGVVCADLKRAAHNPDT